MIKKGRKQMDSEDFEDYQSDSISEEQISSEEEQTQQSDRTGEKR